MFQPSPLFDLAIDLLRRLDSLAGQVESEYSSDQSDNMLPVTASRIAEASGNSIESVRLRIAYADHQEQRRVELEILRVHGAEWMSSRVGSTWFMHDAAQLGAIILEGPSQMEQHVEEMIQACFWDHLIMTHSAPAAYRRTCYFVVPQAFQEAQEAVA